MKTKSFTAFLSVLFVGALAVNSFGSVPPVLPVEVKWTGKEKNLSAVQVIIRDNNPRNLYSISVRNEAGIVVYTENVSAGHVTQKFLFDEEELSQESVIIEVRDRTHDEAVEYRIGPAMNDSREITARKMK